MANLKLCFGTSVLKEYSIHTEPIYIGRNPQSSIFIDNPAVSFNHAQVFFQDDKYYAKDLGSLNGTFVNGARIDQVMLQSGDTIEIGKHTIRFSTATAGAAAAEVHAASEAAKPVQKLEGTMVLDIKTRRDMQEKFAPVAAAQKPAVKKVGKLVVLKGKTSARDFVLASQTTMIGKSDECGVRLKGWFAPKMAAIINKHDETYYLNPTAKNVLVNGQPVTARHELKEGEVITVKSVDFQFHLVAW